MWKTLHLILPVLVPSWRFFKTVEPSPRVQWAMISPHSAAIPHWQEFRPRPDKVTLFQMFMRLFWNPKWNESLFMVSCAERIALTGSPHSVAEIKHRLFRELGLRDGAPTDNHIQFRLVFVQRGVAGPIQDLLFISPLFAATAGTSP